MEDSVRRRFTWPRVVAAILIVAAGLALFIRLTR